MKVARLTEDLLSVDAVFEATQEQYDALKAHPTKAEIHWPYIVDAKPVATALQLVVDGPLVVEPTQVRKTWLLQAKDAGQIEFEELQAEKAQLAQLILDVKTQLDITNATFNAATTNGRFDILRDDRRLTLRALRFILRRIQTGA